MPTSQPTSMLLDDQLCFALYSAAHAIQRRYRPLLAALGLTYPQYLVLLILWEDDGPTVSDIGDRLFLDSATLTPLLKRLESAGFITRDRSAVDQRQVNVRLTQAATDIRQDVYAITDELTCAATDSVDDAADLMANLQQLRTGLLQRTDPAAR